MLWLSAKSQGLSVPLMRDESCNRTRVMEPAIELASTVKLMVSIHEKAEVSAGATTGRPWALLHQMLSRQLLPVARLPA